MNASIDRAIEPAGKRLAGHLLAARLQWPALAVLCLVPIANYHYLLFHTLVELASIIVACGVFVIAWSAYPFSRNRFLLFLGTGLLWVSGLDLFHTLVYKGMNIVPGFEGANAPTQFWIGTRYLHALVLLAAPLFITWPLKRWWAMLGHGVAAGAVLVWILSGNFPDAFVEGTGLTSFKINSEYAIVAIFAMSLVFLWSRRAALDERIFALVAASTGFIIAGEIAFTQYASVFGPANLLGHLFKIVAYWLIYAAIVDRAIAQPFRILAQAANTYDAVPDATVVVDREGEIRRVNEAARVQTGLAGGEAVGRDCHALFHPASVSRDECAACRCIREGTAVQSLELEDARRGRWVEISLAPVAHGEEVSGMVHVSRDITLRKNAAELVRREQALLSAVMQTLPVGVWITDAAGRIVQGNPAGEAVWAGSRYVGIERYGEYKGWWSDTGRKLEPEDWAAARAIRKGESSLNELIDIECFDGTRKTILNSAVPLRDAAGAITGAVMVNQDVTDRREAEREKERLIRDLSERLKELHCLYAISDLLESQGRDLPRVIADIVGLLPAAFQFPDIAVARVACGALEHSSPAFRRTPWRLAADVLVLGQRAGSVEVCYLEERPGIAAGPFFEEERRLVEAVAERVGRVVEHAQAEAHVARLSRLYVTLSNTNQAIIRVTDRQSLFDAVCSIACESGGFARAWIGLGRGGPDGFSVAASRGLDEADRVLLAEAAGDPEGHVASVLRTGAPWHTNDYARDPATSRWHHEQATRGIEGCAIVPLHLGGKVAGVFGLYAKETGHFDAAQLELLDEMASDISFALDNLERDRLRQEAEQALRESEAMLKEAQRIAHIGDWELDLVSNVLKWTAEIYRIFEIDPAQFGASYEAFLDTIHPDDREFVDRTYSESIKNGTPYEIVHRLLMKDGRVKYVTDRCETTYDAAGRPLRSIGTVQDITARKNAEAALRQREEYIGKLVDKSPLAMVVASGPEQRVDLINEKFSQLFGYTLEDMPDIAHWWPLAYPEEKYREEISATWNERVARAIESRGEIEPMEATVRCKDGSIRHVEFRFSSVGDRHLVTFVDLTERKRAEAMRTQLAAIVQSSNDAIIGKDLDGIITSWNPGAEKVYGYRAAEVVGRPISILAPEGRKGEVMRLIGKVRAGASVANFETERFRKDGRRIDVSLALSPITDPSGRIIGVSTIARDVTEKKIAEVALRKVNRALVTLSRCNEVLVHAIAEQSLLDSMCRVIVEEGGYRLAWVGYAQDDAGKSLLPPVASAGPGVEYLSQVSISWAAETPNGNGPCGRAIRLGVAQVVQDAMHDPAFAPWHEMAARLGFASLLVLPLLVSNGERRAGGVLAIYSGEHDAFDEQETSLLSELASDLSYGIAVLRAREERKRAGERLEHSLENTIRSIAMALEKRDPYTAGHQRRVSELAMAIGRELGLDEHTLVGLRFAATIHDIGKIYVPSEILNRPGKLTPIEFELIKTHAQVGYEIVKGIDFPWRVADMILQHHERLDGSGYPNGLKADAICFEARILAVADVVEAMASHRPYRATLGMDAALTEVEAKRGVLFDERIVNACTALIREGRFGWSKE